MYQEELHNQINIEYQDVVIHDKDKVLLFNSKGEAILKSWKQECFFTYAELMQEPRTWTEMDFYYLFSIGEERYFVLTGEVPETISDSYPAFSRREVFSSRSDAFSYVILTASHIHDWYKRTKFCGVCGERTVLRKGERAKSCDSCGNRIYPQINPVVIVGISHGDKLLLTKYANRDYSSYSLVAGFVEVGETLEAAVKREAMEETGVQLKNIQYFNSQPWGITGGLLSGFFAELDGDSTLTVDYDELSEASWISVEEVMQMQLNTKSLTGTMIDAWRRLK